MAANNMKAVKLRIKSVQSTMQITKAMELVASSKLRKAKERADVLPALFPGASSDASGYCKWKYRFFLGICQGICEPEKLLCGNCRRQRTCRRI